MNDTGNENRMVDDPQISFRTLRDDLALMRFAGFWPTTVECGPLTFEAIINWVICGNPPISPGDYWTEDRILEREAAMRKAMWEGKASVEFNGMPVTCHDDVPDGRLWPPRERSGVIVKPFPGTEAYLAI